MGRPPIGDRAMTAAERQRRYAAKRGRKIATAVARLSAEVEQLRNRSPAPIDHTLDHLFRYGLPVARWARRKYGDHATRGAINALSQALDDPTIQPDAPDDDAP